MKKILVLLIIIIVAFSMGSCNKDTIKADDIKEILIRENSLKAVYNVDEQIDFSNAYIIIYLKNGKESWAKVDENMLEGFDSSTTTDPTELRWMRVKYLGLYTSEWYYSVTSNYVIDTKTRITINAEQTANQLKVKLSVDYHEASRISAIKMNIDYDNTKLTFNDSINILRTGWRIENRNVRAGSFACLYYAYNSTPITESGDLLEFVFDVTQSGNANIEIKAIEISDGEKDTYLPDVKLY